MGKLHTLRRAIRRDLAAWRGAVGAGFDKRTGQWVPYRLYWSKGPYLAFIRKVLRSC